MSEFDLAAGSWDEKPYRQERAQAVATAIREVLPMRPGMQALEYGAGTALLGFSLADTFDRIVLMDSSPGMVQVMRDKVCKTGQNHLEPICFDLEQAEYREGKFDCIFNLMVMHHLCDVKSMVAAFFALLNPGGWLAMADLYAEDGTFHGEGFTGHPGFEPRVLAGWLREAGFCRVTWRGVYEIRKKAGEELRSYPVFLMTAARPEGRGGDQGFR